jgi:glycosyltransferase involved in cell wall biosynthesis
MKILMIAPEPFFEPRGTPFSEYFRIKALSALGHTVDLVTYPFGVDKAIPGLKIFRCRKLPWIKSVRTGPSFNKVALDIFLFLKVIQRLWHEDYDLIHSHEEGSIIGVFCQKMTKIPHLYDMHSSLVQQMENFNFTRSKIIVYLFKLSETIALKNATAVIVICRSLFEYAAGITAADKLTLIENFMDDRPGVNNEEKFLRLQREINPDRKKIIMYTGTLEAYQGIPLLLESLRLLDDDFRLIVIGGKENQLDKLRRQILEMKLEKRVIPASGLCPGFAANPGNQYSAENLFLPGQRRACRGHRPRHPYPIDQQRHCHPGRRCRRTFCRCHQTSRRPPGTGGCPQGLGLLPGALHYRALY